MTLPVHGPTQGAILRAICSLLIGLAVMCAGLAFALALAFFSGDDVVSVWVAFFIALSGLVFAYASVIVSRTLAHRAGLAFSHPIRTSRDPS
jgi:hypothetical protein